MAIKITDECINCGACEPECPNNAIYESGVGWKFSDGTSLNSEENFNGKKINADVLNTPIEEEFFYIVTDKCTECNGFYDEPQCAAVCPVDCCIIDEDNIETKDELIHKKKWLHKD
tara:strand:+ start:1932 stop:2279 length:348 start_codon:yes stop_codon:yes gene_type:complete